MIFLQEYTKNSDWSQLYHSNWEGEIDRLMNLSNSTEQEFDYLLSNVLIADKIHFTIRYFKEIPMSYFLYQVKHGSPYFGRLNLDQILHLYIHCKHNNLTFKSDINIDFELLMRRTKIDRILNKLKLGTE
jgi:hypothetical protein